MEDGIPAFPRDLADRWAVGQTERLADTHTSFVYRVRRLDGSLAIAKLLKPEGLHEVRGFEFLRWRGGCGAVRLLDAEGSACLLEDAGRSTLRSWREEHGDDAASAVIASLVRQLHAGTSSPDPAGLMPLQQHFRPLFAQAEASQPPALRGPLRHCAAIAAELLDQPSDSRPLHGDLHHDNIISGGGRGWLAIDPQGLMGDAAYEVANVFGNPAGAFPGIVAPSRILSLCRTFAPLIGCGEATIIRYAIAHAGLSVSWSLEDDRPTSEGSDAFERLAFIEVASRLLASGAFSF